MVFLYDCSPAKISLGFLLTIAPLASSAPVPFKVRTPATVLCPDLDEGCCPAQSEGYVKIMEGDQFLEYRDYGDSFYCSAEHCDAAEDFGLTVQGPAKVVCPNFVYSDCQSNQNETILYEGQYKEDTLAFAGYDLTDTLTFKIDNAEEVTCSTSCDIREESQAWTGFVELDCGKDNDLSCRENGTNAPLLAENDRVIVDYFQVVWCPKSCKVVTESTLLIGPAQAACAACYLDRGIPANATIDNTTGITVTEAAFGQKLRCPSDCPVVANSTRIQGPALITCNPDDDDEEEEVGLLGCQEEDEGNSVVPNTEVFDNQFFVDSHRFVRCDQRCSVQESEIVYSPAIIECKGPTFGCHSDTLEAANATLEFEEGAMVEIRAEFGEYRCDAEQCQVIEGNGTLVEGPAFVNCTKTQTEDSEGRLLLLGCEGGGRTSADGNLHHFGSNSTGRCDPACDVVQHRTIHGPTEVWCPKDDESITGPMGFGCVREQDEDATGEELVEYIKYNLECGDVAHCNQHCLIEGKKVGAEPEKDEISSGVSSGSRPTTGRIWKSVSLLVVAVVAVGGV